MFVHRSGDPPDCLRCLTLRLVPRIPSINRQIMLPFTERLFDTLPALHRTQPLPPTLPHLLKVITLTFLRNSGPALEVIEDPETISPGSDHNVDQAKLFAEKEGTFWVHLTREFFKVVQELGLPVL
jgi:hypothetical protein